MTGEHAPSGRIGRGRRAIIIGAGGYLGRHLVRAIAEAGGVAMPYDLTDATAVTGVPCSRLDVTDPLQLARVDWNVDVVHVVAGLTGTLESFDRAHQFVRANELGLLNVLGAIRNAGARPRIVFPSSRLVYRGANRPLREDAPKDPRTVYAVSKLACEMHLAAFRACFDIPFTIFRLCVPFGNPAGGSYSFGTMGSFVRQARSRGVIRLFGGGTASRTFSHVEEVCRLLVTGSLDNRCDGETFNLPGEDLSLRDAAQMVAERFGASIEDCDWPELDRRIESGDTVFDSSKLGTILPGRGTVRLQDWVRSSTELVG
jgi:UDP-glucose 4-epimerase